MHELSSSLLDTQNSETTLIRRRQIKIALFIGAIIILVAGLVAIILFFTVFHKPDDIPAKILFLNDIHFDPFFLPNGDPKNNICRIPHPNKTTEYTYGIYTCDTPTTLMDSLVSYIQKNIKKPDMIVFGGDSLAHKLHLSKEMLASNWSYVVESLSGIFPGVPFFPVLGNNEYVINYGTFDTDLSDFENLYSGLKPHLSPSQAETFLKGGYYYHDIKSVKTRVVFMNSVIYSSKRAESSELDPYGQLDWLEEVSKSAGNYRIGIVYHIPTGISSESQMGWYEKYVDRFDAIISKYGIRFILTGHVHSDLLLPVKTSANPFYQLSSVSISPAHANNPGFRVYTVDEEGDIADFSQYYTDLILNPHPPVWSKEYTFSTTYHVPKLDQASIRKAVAHIQTSAGRWHYLEHMKARGADSAVFFHCLLTSSTKADVDECLEGTQPMLLLPYGEAFRSSRDE